MAGAPASCMNMSVAACCESNVTANTSGVSTTERLVDVTEENYDYVFDTNTRGAFFGAQTVAKRMRARVARGKG